MAKTRTVTQISDDILDKNEKIKALNAAVKVLEEEKAALDKELIAECQTSGDLKQGKGAKSKFSITQSVVPVLTPEGWDKFYKYIKRNNWFHLLDRRPSLTGCRELWEQGRDIPGVDKFVKLKVTVTGA